VGSASAENTRSRTGSSYLTIRFSIHQPGFDVKQGLECRRGITSL
jgi:hypothetical protein